MWTEWFGLGVKIGESTVLVWTTGERGGEAVAVNQRRSRRSMTSPAHLWFPIHGATQDISEANLPAELIQGFSTVEYTLSVRAPACRGCRTWLQC